MTATESANRGEPLCAEAHLLRARALTQLGRRPEARSALSKAVDAVQAADEAGVWLAPFLNVATFCHAPESDEELDPATSSLKIWRPLARYYECKAYARLLAQKTRTRDP